MSSHYDPDAPPFWWPWQHWNPFDNDPRSPHRRNLPPEQIDPNPDAPAGNWPIPWAFPGDLHDGRPDSPDPDPDWPGDMEPGSKGKGKGHKKAGRGVARRAKSAHKKPATVRVHQASGAGSAGRSSHPSVYSESTQDGGAMPSMELSGSSEGLFDVLVELVGGKNISLGKAMQLYSGEQDRIANRLWRRPGGLARTSGL